jgi:hypothetical protein
MEQALMCLGLTEIAAREFTDNGINSLDRLRLLMTDGLDRLIKQIHRDNQGAGLFIPFFSQRSIHSIHFWTNCMYILGIPYELNQVTKELPTVWNRACKSEIEAVKAMNNLDIVKQPEHFKKETKWKQWKEGLLTDIFAFQD